MGRIFMSCLLVKTGFALRFTAQFIEEDGSQGERACIPTEEREPSPFESLQRPLKILIRCPQVVSLREDIVEVKMKEAYSCKKTNYK